MRAINPIKFLMFSFFIWIVFYMLIPVKYLYNGSVFFPVITLLLFILSFVLGVLSLKKKSLPIIKEPSIHKLKQIVYLLFIIGLIGVLFKVYIGFFKSGIFVAQDILEKRLENMGKELSGGVIGVFASLLYPFSFISLLISIYNYKRFNRFFLLIVIITGLYPMIETFFMGGRTIMVLLGVTLLFVVYASFFKNTKAHIIKIKIFKANIITLPKVLFKRKVIISLLLIGVLFASYSTKVVNSRLSRFAYGNHTFNIMEHQNNRWVKFDKEFKTKYFNSPQEDKNTMMGLYSLEHYFVHGVFEYIRLVNDLDSVVGYHYGQYEFNVFFKFFRTFGIPLKSFEELNYHIKRKSVYQTFWGPFYLDFGLLGVIIIFFWGRFVKRVYIHANRGSTQHLIFYAYLSTIIITSFYLNFLLGSSSYYLFAFFITLLVFKYWPNKLIFVINAKT